MMTIFNLMMKEFNDSEVKSIGKQIIKYVFSSSSKSHLMAIFPEGGKNEIQIGNKRSTVE